MINSCTIPAILIGNPVIHSKSPLIHNAAFKHLKINSVYLAVNIESGDFDTVISGFKKIDLLGINVTLPYKTSILSHLDIFDDDARLIGSVNTIEINDKVWTGHNTDWFGIYKTLGMQNLGNMHKVLVIGAGGSSPSAVYALQKYNIADITVTNRTMSKAEQLQKQFNVKIIDYKNLNNNLQDYSMIINTTTIDFDRLIKKFDQNTVYFDLKYYTGKLKIKNYIDGTDMLLYQASKAFEIWTKSKAPINVMKKAIKMK